MRSAAWLAGLAVLGWALVAVAAPPPSTRDLAYEAKIQQEIEARDPKGAQLFAQATAARDRGDLDQAADLFGQVRALDPWFVAATRRLCGVESSRGQHDQAVALCRQAYKDDPSAIDGAALALALLEANPTGQTPWEAAEHARSAAKKAPDDAYVQQVLCQASLAVNDMDALGSCAAVLRRLAPDDMSTSFFCALDDAAHGRLDEADRELDQAYARGLPDEVYGKLHTAIGDSRSPVDRYGGPALRAVIGWFATFGVLLLLGAILSRAALRSAGRVPSERTGHARGFDAVLRRTYRVVLWVTCAFYYASLPLVALSVVALGGGLVYACFAIGTIPIKLVLIAILLVCASLWAIAKSLFVRARDEDPGEKIDLAQHPRLREVLEEVAQRVGTRPVDAVYVTPGTDIAVTERGGLLRQMRGRSERCLILGAAVLEGMRVRELKAILAHEYGHFQNEDTAGGGFALAVRRSLMTMALHLVQSRAASALNPAWWFVRGFHAAFLRVSQGASRLQEVLADRWAAFAYGSESFVRGLTHVMERSARFDAHVNATLGEVVPAKQPLANLYGFVPKEPVDPKKVDQEIEQAMARPAHPYDSHPRPADRIAWVRKIAAPDPPETEQDTAQAWSLLSEREDIERRMTDEVRSRLAMRGIRVVAAAWEPVLAARREDVRGPQAESLAERV